MRRNGGRRDVRASGVELLQSSCFVLSGVRSTLLKRNTNMAIVWTRSTGNTGLRPLRGYELKCVYAVYRGGGEVKEFDRFLWITPGTTSFFSLSVLYTFVVAMSSFFRRRKREREARNFRIKIFEPYCFAYIFRFAISSGARLLYTKKQHVPGRMTRQVILRNEKLRGLSEWSFSCVRHGTWKWKATDAWGCDKLDWCCWRKEASRLARINCFATVIARGLKSNFSSSLETCVSEHDLRIINRGFSNFSDLFEQMVDWKLSVQSTNLQTSFSRKVWNKKKIVFFFFLSTRFRLYGTTASAIFILTLIF